MAHIRVDNPYCLQSTLLDGCMLISKIMTNCSKHFWNSSLESCVDTLGALS